MSNDTSNSRIAGCGELPKPGGGFTIMKRFAVKLAIMVLATAPAWAGDASVRNCTWCHGTSGQGYTVAPRLAGQRPQYVESQIRSFHDHLRNNPFSKQYMWSAVAALGSQGAHDLALYFAAIPPKPASDGDRNLAAKGRTICMEGIPDAISPPATPVMALTRRACVTSPSWRPCLFLPESRVRAVGAGVSFEPPIFDAYRGARARPR